MTINDADTLSVRAIDQTGGIDMKTYVPTGRQPGRPSGRGRRKTLEASRDEIKARLADGATVRELALAYGYGDAMIREIARMPPEASRPSIGTMRQAARAAHEITGPLIVPVCGIYGLVHDDRIVYVGESLNIFRRPWEHRDKAFEAVKIILVCNPGERLEAEATWIHNLHPELNRTCPRCEFYD